MHFGKSQSQQRYAKKEQCQSQYVVETKSPQVSHLRPWFQVEHFTISFFLFFVTRRGIAHFGLGMASVPSALYITTLSKRLTRDTQFTGLILLVITKSTGTEAHDPIRSFQQLPLNKHECLKHLHE